MQNQSKQLYHLSAQQGRLWLAKSEGSLGFAQGAVRITGSLDPQALRQAFQEVVERREILRTGFRRQPGRKRPLQAVSTTAEPEWIEADGDLAALAAARAGDLPALFAFHRAPPLDLEAGSLLRLTLFALGEREHLLLVTLPTLCADARSLALLVDEVAQVCSRPPGENADEDPVQYVDFSQWQDELLAEEDDEAREGKAFWGALDLARADLRFPFERRTDPGVAEPPFQPRRQTLALPPARTHEIEAAAAHAGVSLEIYLLACWQVLLRRVTGRPDALSGRLFDGRIYEDLRTSLGLFASILPLAGPEGEPPFSRYLELLGEEAATAARWQAYGLAEGVGAAPEPRPSLPVVFEYQDDRQAASGGDPAFSLIGREVDFGRFRLKLRCLRTDGGALLEIHADPDLGPTEEAGRWLERLDTLLKAALAEPERRIGELDILGAAEGRQLLAGFNRTARDFAGEPVHRRFAAQAALFPERPAVICEDRVLTCAELDRQANRLAHHLRALGIGPEDRVALFLERSVESIVGILGVLKAGGAYVPLDPSFPGHRLAAMLEDCDAGAIVTLNALLGALPDACPAVVRLDGDADLLARRSAEEPAGGATAGNLAYVLFTSGSTGRPKGVAVEHRQLANYVDAVLERMEVPPGASFATVSTLAADLGNTMIFPSLCTGGTLHVIAPDRASDATAFAEYCTRHAIDCLKIVPSHLSALLKSDRAELLPRRRLILGGEASSRELVEQVERLAPECRILNHYGPTETTVGVMTHRVEPADGATARRRLPLGRPLANCSVYLLSERLMPVPFGSDGELYVGGCNVSRGYLGRPDLTAERFLPDPFAAEPGRRFYRTGDVARFLAEGYLEFVGRADRQVKIRGFRIEPGEIEAALLQHPAIREAVVTVRQEGAQEKRLVAWLVLRPGQRPSSDELRAFCRDKLSDAMTPAAFVNLDALPLTANGKVDLQALPSPEQSRPEATRDFTPPRTAAEQVLATIWSQVLGLEQVGVSENFFDLGGDSILAIQVIAKANQAGLRLNPKLLFEHQTIAALAGAAKTAPEVQAEQEALQGAVPLTPIQHWFFAQGFADPHHWNQSLLFELAQELPVPLLERAAASLLEHHDALRMRFERTAEGWRQSIANPRDAAPGLLHTDLSALPAETALAAATQAAAEIQASLDLQRGPLFRIAVLAPGKGRPARILIVIHHLVVDGVSWRVLLDDFTAVCEQLAQGLPVALPPKTTSFRQWAERLCAYARSPSLQGELTVWRAALAEREPVPIDFEGDDTVASESLVTTFLGAAETRALLQDVPAAYRAQINDLLLTALARGWARWSGRPSLLVDLEGHGREDLFEGVDLSRTAGWFTTHFPVLLSGAEANPGTSLKTVKETLRGIPGRGIGYGLLRYVGPPESAETLRELPEPMVKFNYLGQLDRGLAGAASIRPVPGSAGPTHSPRARRTHLLAIDGSVIGGELRLAWRYSRNRHRKATIESLARSVDGELRALITHCLETGAGGCTPSDFPLTRLGQAELDHLLAALPAPAGATDRPAHRWVEDLYPVSPLQKSLLSHLLALPGTTVGFEQKSTTLRGAIDPDVFERVWQSIVDRHPILRTAFVWDGVDEPLQVVSRRAALRLERHDWSGLAEADRSARLASFLAADRERGFDLARAPLMRIALLRLTEETCQFVWSYSHLLLDAWCRTLVLREVFSTYKALVRGGEAELSQTRPYREYIAWLQRQNLEEAAAFWRAQLSGFTGLTPFRVEWLAEPPVVAEAYASAVAVLPTATLDGLQSSARHYKVTLNTLVQGAWAVLLGRYSGESEVVFGFTVSGRPPALPGVDTMIGMFINNLPVRAHISGEARVGAWLQEIQGRLTGLREFEFCSQDQIRAWSGVPWGQRLFDSLVLFQNYPVDDLAAEEESAGVEILSYRGRLETSYPLTVVVAPSSALRLEIFYQTRRFDAATIERMLRHLTGVLESLAADAERPLAAVSLLTAPERRQILDEWSAAPRFQGLESVGPLRRQALESALAAGSPVYVLGRDRELVPVGVPGELCLGGLPPESDGTGELARLLPDGQIELLGQIDEREEAGVHLGIIAAALRHHPAVEAAAVRTWANEAGDRRLVAYLVAGTAGTSPTADELRASLRRRLPQSMVPALFVFLDALPRTAEGEVDTAALPPPESAGSRTEAAFIAARDPIELMLVQVWEELFGIHPIGIRDDFFELGGYSLLAVQLLSRIPGHFGRKLPLSTLVRAGTVEKLAELLRHEAGSRPWSPLIELQAGDGRPPLFCLHPLGGEVLCYRDLAVALGADQPFFALQARGWEDNLAPHESIEEMATCYLEAIRGIQPEGPYCLAGWSFGGLVALEMAQQLRSVGEEVSLLAILDTTVDRLPIAKPERLGKLARFEQEHPSLSFSEMWELASQEEELQSELEAIKRAFRVPAGLDPQTVRRYQRAGQSLAKVKGTYQPSPYAGPITLFRAARGHILNSADPTFGWSRLAIGGLEIVDVPGSHNDMVYRPHVQDLARRLRERLASIASPVRSGAASTR